MKGHPDMSHACCHTNPTDDETAVTFPEIPGYKKISSHLIANAKSMPKDLYFGELLSVTEMMGKKAIKTQPRS